MNNERTKAEQLVASTWPGIHLEKRLGKGAYGSVYECVKTDAATNFTTREALKIIDMTFDDIESLAEEEGTTPDSYYQRRKKEAIDEIEIMYRLKSPHIVHINDYAVIEKDNLEGFYILIRMDVLTSLANVMKEHTEDSQAEAEELAKKVGLDICDALILCRKKNIVHRDIKPQNVFISDNGEFYLGDFGVAKSLSGHLSNLSYKGTELYIAPEVALGKYDHRVDLYSLGLLLYQLLNHRRMPFCPAYPKIQSAEDTQDAYVKRVISREPVPAPDNCSPAFAKIVLKLCEYNPDNRYKNAEELKEALLALDQAKTEQKTGASAGNPAPISAPITESSTPAPEIPKPVMGSSSAAPENPSPVRPDTAFGNSGAFPGSAGFCTQDNSAVPEKGSRAVPEPLMPVRKPDKKKLPIWALAVVATVVVIAGALLFGKTVFAPKDDSGASLTQSEHVGEPDASDSTDKAATGNTDIDDTAAPIYSGEGIKLTSLNIVEGDGAEVKEDIVNSLGESFEEAVSILGWNHPIYARFYVRDYERIVGNYSCPENDTRSGETFELSIYLDDAVDAPVLKVDMSRSTASTPFDIDLSGADFITFHLDNKGCYSPGLLLTDCFLYSSGAQTGAVGDGEVANPQAGGSSDVPPASDGVRLTSLNIVESDGAEVREDVTNSLGQSFEEAVSILGWNHPIYARFYVRDYERIVGNYSCPENDTRSGETFELSIYLDDAVDAPVLKVDMSRSTASTPFDIDLSGADFITFHLDNKGCYSPGLLLTDCYLTK